MKLRKLTATFGCLDGATLTFGPGLTLIGAPNGSGKSTWCAFLRVMLYGLDTRQRDRKGAPADKNRYRPWNGKPMEGLLECEHQGAVILLRRTSAGGVPMGDFSAVYQATGLPVPGLTADNAGEVLTGLSRDGYTVFDWTVTSGDDGGEGQPVPLAPEEIARNALERGEGQSSPVILLHDSHPFTTTPEAVRQIIRAYKARGYRFGVLTADTRPLVFSDWWDILSGD